MMERKERGKITEKKGGPWGPCPPAPAVCRHITVYRQKTAKSCPVSDPIKLNLGNFKVKRKNYAFFPFVPHCYFCRQIANSRPPNFKILATPLLKTKESNKNI
jgi:hypothetical protein